MTSRLRAACWAMPAIATLGTLLACGDASPPHGAASAQGHRERLEVVAAAPPSEADTEADIDHTAVAPDAQAADPTEGAAHAYMFTCETDSDCVAVPKAGLCRNGVKEAVNHRHADIYRNTFSKMRRGPCTFLLIRDRRVAACDKQAGRCVLVVQHKKPRLPAVFTPDRAGH